MSVMYAPLDGLSQALEIQGGMAGPSEVRDDAGLYLHHDISDYLSRYQTYHTTTYSAGTTTPGAGQVFAPNPDLTGLRYGRYLLAVGVNAAGTIANLTGMMIVLQSSGLQAGYPTCIGNLFYYAPADVLQTAPTSWWFYPKPASTTLPIWCPPGTYINLHITTAGVSGTYSSHCLWATTEQQNQAMTAPIGVLRAPVKV